MALRTREQLLEIADEHITKALNQWRDPSAMSANAHLTQACVALAKEMREAEQVVTCANADAMTQMLSLIQQTLAAK